SRRTRPEPSGSCRPRLPADAAGCGGSLPHRAQPPAVGDVPHARSRAGCGTRGSGRGRAGAPPARIGGGSAGTPAAGARPGTGSAAVRSSPGARPRAGPDGSERGAAVMDTPAFWIIVTGILVAGSCGFIGCFLILRRMAMLGDAISHSVLLGLVVAFLLTHSTGALPMFIGAVVAGLFTSFVVQSLSEGGVQEDAAIGVTFTALFALGVVLLSVYAGRIHLDVEHVLYGEIAYVPWDTLEVGGRYLGPRAVWIVGGVFLLSLMVVGIWFKEFKICAFDPDLAAAFGIPVGVFHYALMTLVSLTTVAAFENVGAILSVAML